MHVLPNARYQHQQMPHVEKGMSVGLFGGSFNPPHEGHVLVAKTALMRLRLGKLWWIVSPSNPLKNSSILAPLEQRIASSEVLLNDPRICVTAFETSVQTRCSADTIVSILKRNPGVHFVWIMGSDNLAIFHRWQKWRWIVNTIPIAVIDRQISFHTDISSPMAWTFARFRVAENMAALLSLKKAPAWTLIHGRRSSMSSTILRTL
ncbi:MAG: nicotinate-nucleotide adenylyltransferase [Candidatus Tokpelaia sp. JSC085]|nr:MAG: nicotinate-nucleotide adenylyltransferase [Candidatus Tokpelaia sp. JSC085]